MIGNILSVTMAVLCLVLLARLVVGPLRRQRFDATVARLWLRLRQTVRHALQWRARRKVQTEAAKEARDVIERARAKGVWKDNVFTPDRFRGPKKSRRDVPD